MKRELTLLVDGDQIVVTVERDRDTIVVERPGERHVVRVIGDRIVPADPSADATRGGDSGAPRATSGAAATPPGTPPPPPAANLASVSSGQAGAVRSPMVGVVREIHVSEGDTVAAGDRVITMEAMKMDIYVNAPAAGVVAGVACAAGESVAEGAVLATIEASGSGG